MAEAVQAKEEVRQSTGAMGRPPPLRSLPFTVVHSEDVAGDVAGQVMAGARARGFRNADVMSFSKFQSLKFDKRKQVVIFVLQTIENGQPPENAGKCLRWLARKAHPPTMLEGALFFGVLGLGDSNLLLDRQTTTAKDCNQAGQKLDKRLGELGARRLCARGDADERTGFQEVDPWCEELWAQLVPDDVPVVSPSGDGSESGGATRAGGLGGTGSGGGGAGGAAGGGGGRPPIHPSLTAPMKDSSSSNSSPAAPERPSSPMPGPGGRNNSDQAGKGVGERASEAKGGRRVDLSKEVAVAIGAGALVVLGVWLVILSTRKRRP